MMERRNFLRNAMIAIAVSLVPKILQPVVVEIPAEVVSLSHLYDPTKTYMIKTEWGVMWGHGACLNEMNRIFKNQFSIQ